MMGTPPVIIIGMHRSGTSMVSRLLQRMGIHMGWLKDANNEATLFRALNDWILRQAGAAWDHPEPVPGFMAREAVRRLSGRYAEDVLRSVQALSYLGPWRWLKHRDVFNQPYSWGWKDPRNTFTLPLWRDLFPDAKIIHVMRHGVDVAASLRDRTRASFQRYNAWKPATGYLTRSMRYWKRPIEMVTIDSIRSLELDGGFELWRIYVEEARRQLTAHRRANAAMEVSFERLLKQPIQTLGELSDFFELGMPQHYAKEIAGLIDDRHAFAFRRNPELVTFAYSRRAELAQWGYRAS